MSISSSASNNKNLANVANKEGAISNTPVTLSERSITGFALIRIFVGYLWFQQLFWKLPPTFAGLYGYIVRESQHAIIPGYGALLQHTFLAGCAGSTAPTGCTLFVPLAACVWTAEGWLYVAAVIDLFSRRVVGWSMSAAMTAQLVTDALVMAIWRRGKPDALQDRARRAKPIEPGRMPKLTCSTTSSASTTPSAATRPSVISARWSSKCGRN